MNDEVTSRDYPGRGFFGWLGRQIGYVKKAIAADVGSKKIYRSESVQEQPHPAEPNLTLRRTTIDEVIVEPPLSAKCKARPAPPRQ